MEKQMKFTPGPWETHIDKADNRIAINNKTLRKAISCGVEYPNKVELYNGRRIDAVEHQANASLIASAPDMYEALELAETEMKYAGWDKRDPDNIGKNAAYLFICDTLAKARGKIS